jgi:hypothetical protein
VRTPVMLPPAVVPKEKTTPVTLLVGVNPAALIVQVAVWFRNGLWDGLPAMEPLALV